MNRSTFTPLRGAMLGAVLLASGLAHARTATDGCTIAGPDNAPVVIEEYVDFHCRFCKKGAAVTKKILRNYPDKVRLVLRNMPLAGHGPGAAAAAKAFAAVWLQSPALAFSFQEQLFDRQHELIARGDVVLFETATRIGANVNQMKSDMQGSDIAEILATDQQAATAHGFKGTPSFVVGSETVTGARPYNELKAILDRQLTH